jgi:protein-S-isoprenylcysteine O-methyltransferase Ste14
MFSAESPFVHTLFLVTIVGWLLLELRQAQKERPEATPADGGSRSVVRISYVAGYIGAIGADRIAPSATLGSADLVSWIGLAAMWCGIGLRLWSFQTLGRYFTFTVQTSEDQPVISSGPYRVIRHPSYAGVLVAAIGIGLVIGNWASLAVLTVVIACGLIYRITVEERALSRDLAGRYQAYAASRKRLIPFIW